MQLLLQEADQLWVNHTSFVSLFWHLYNTEKLSQTLFAGLSSSNLILWVRSPTLYSDDTFQCSWPDIEERLPTATYTFSRTQHAVYVT